MPSARLAGFVAGELVATTATAVVQSQRGADTNEIIGAAVGVATLIGIAWAVSRFFLLPLLHNWWRAVFNSDRERTGVDVVKAMDASDDTRAVFRRYNERVFADRLVELAELRDTVDANRDRLLFLEESNTRQGEAITKELARAMDHMARSTDQQTRIMERIQKELEDHSIIIARLDERIQGWQGEERRGKPRP